MVENREKKSSNPATNPESNDSSQALGQAQARTQSQQRRQQPSDLVQRRPRLNAEEETRRRNERANELRLKNRSNRIR